VQFKTARLYVVPPTTLEGIEKYLGSGMVKGIGPHFANKLSWGQVHTAGSITSYKTKRNPPYLIDL
jgi:hypothetical protein